jgi:hypothetical protein
MTTAYDNDEQLHDILIKEGFEVIEKFGQVTAYSYLSKTHKCMALLLVHHALSKMLTSRAPWENQGPVRGEAEVEEHSITAVTFLWIHAVMMTANNITDDFQPDRKMQGNPVTTFAFIMYLLKRWHMRDSRVAVAFGKAMLAPEKEPLDDKFGLTQKNITNPRHGFSIAERVALFLSNATKETLINTVDAAFVKFFQDKINQSGGNIIDISPVMSSLKLYYLDKEGKLYKTLWKRINREFDRRKEAAQQNVSKTDGDHKDYLAAVKQGLGKR